MKFSWTANSQWSQQLFILSINSCSTPCVRESVSMRQSKLAIQPPALNRRSTGAEDGKVVSYLTTAALTDEYDNKLESSLEGLSFIKIMHSRRFWPHFHDVWQLRHPLTTVVGAIPIVIITCSHSIHIIELICWSVKTSCCQTHHSCSEQSRKFPWGIYQKSPKLKHN